MNKRLIAGLILAILLPGVAFGVTSNSVVTMQTPTRGLVQFLQGSDTAGTYKTLYTAGASGSRCYAMWMTTTDATAVHLVTVQIVNTSVKYGGTAISTVASAGFSNTSMAISLMAPGNWPGLPLDSDGNPYVQLQSGDTLQATYATALTTSAVINIVATCADF